MLLNSYKVKVITYVLLALIIISGGVLVYFNGPNPFLVYFKQREMPGKIVSLDKEFTLHKAEIAHLRNGDVSFYFYFQGDKLVTQFIFSDWATKNPAETPYNLKITHQDRDNYTASFIISKK